MTSFGKELFLGRLRLDLLDPLPAGKLSEGDAEFLIRLRAFCVERVEPRRTRKLSDDILDGLRDLGAFVMRLPTEHGGLGLSALAYHRALTLAATAHPALAELLGPQQIVGREDPVPAVRDGDGYRLSGVRPWAGAAGGPPVVLAEVPDAGVSAFLVRPGAPGVRAGSAGMLRLQDATVTVADRIGAEGAGLAAVLALRQATYWVMPAASVANAKRSLKIAREIAIPASTHEVAAGSIAYIAATAFALEAMLEVTSRCTDLGADTRPEVVLARLFADSKAGQITDELVRIGGRDAVAARGEPADYVARGPKLWVDPDALTGDRPELSWTLPSVLAREFGQLSSHIRFADKTSRKLVQHLDCGRGRWGESVVERQLFLGRVADIAAELYAMTVACVYAKSLTGPAVDLADAFCRQARRRVAEVTDRLWVNTDEYDVAVAAEVLANRHTWFENGVDNPLAGAGTFDA